MKRGICFMTFTIVIGILSPNTAPTSIVTDGLVSYWTFDRKYIMDKIVKDVWGNNNGTLIGNPKVVPGQVGEALEFDGVDDFVNLTTLGDFGGQIGTSSFEAWIKTRNKKDWMTLINTHGDECPNWGIELNGINVRNEFEIMKGTLHNYLDLDRLDLRALRSCGKGGIHIADIFDGEWHHIVYTYDYMINEGGMSGSHKIIIYIDGVSEILSRGGFAGTSKRGFSPFTAPVHLGARKFPGKAHGHFTGMIDEVRLYDRPLTADEVIQNFESTEPYDIAPKGKLPTVWATLKTQL
ncbi:LamG domain-containing protein [Candidatus Poribacteria bacterium]|nr:LamG domain-containing protein [Candidatus Poribacteria bacterium]